MTQDYSYSTTKIHWHLFIYLLRINSDFLFL